jgi:5-methylcytosine-specific restriction endonuclease McrA
MQNYIYVTSASGKPLMPTTRNGHVRRLLNAGKARITCHVPFMIQLKYETPEITQGQHGGSDSGRTNLGVSAINDEGTVTFKAHVESRNREVPKNMAERKTHRKASRAGERFVRKRLAKKNGTTTTFPKGRMLPRYEKPLMLKDIINTEARFNNRKRLEGWITPTTRQCIQTQLNVVDLTRKLLPVTDWTYEANRFVFMRMEDGTIFGSDFQNGRMKGYKNAREYITALQEGKCAICGGPIDHIHHITPRSEGGSDTPENMVGLCSKCHEDVHLGKLSLASTGLKKKYAALSVLNQAIPYIYQGLVERFGEEHVHICFGHQTEKFRKEHGILKGHANDAVCIAAIGAGINTIHDDVITHEIKQFRRHDRQLIKSQRERTYYLDGKPVCKNRHKRFEQKCDSLEEFRDSHPDEICRLTVKPSTRYYNDPKRDLPGAVFWYKGQRYVLSGQLSNGKQYRAVGCGTQNFNALRCNITERNKGLVWLY